MKNRVLHFVLVLTLLVGAIVGPVGATETDVLGDTTVELAEDFGYLAADGLRWRADLADDGVQNGSVALALLPAASVDTAAFAARDAALPYIVTRQAVAESLSADSAYLVTLTGAQIQALLDQAVAEDAPIYGSGLTWYRYRDVEQDAGGAYGIEVNGVPLEREQLYSVAVSDLDAGAQRVALPYTVDAAVSDYVVAQAPLDAGDVGPARVQALDKVVTILHTNDTHGNWAAGTYKDRTNGMVYLASLVEDERALNPNTLLLDAGDTFQGNSFAYFFKDADENPIAGGMNLMGYDAMVPGNHEYNFGPATFANMLGQLDFPILGKANVEDDGSYGFINDNMKEYITMTVDGLDVAIFGLTNAYVTNYEFPDTIPGLSFHPATETVRSLVPAIENAEDPDLLIGLTHVGYDVQRGEEGSDEQIAQVVAGIDVLLGGHTHTPITPSVTITSAVNPTGTLVAQTERYALFLGKVNVGFTGNITDGYEIAMREGYLIPAGVADAPEPALSTYLQPFLDQIDVYNSTAIGQTAVPIDAQEAFTEETNGANLQTDAAVWELEQKGVDVDFHLSGAMSDKMVGDGATATDPVTLTRGDMFNLMPYENLLVVMQMNGPQIKTILERSYRNYWWYKYNPDGHYGGYSHYATCMLDINAGGEITYRDTYPAMPNGNNVASLVIDGQSVNFDDAETYYNVSSVNYVAAGSCNFSDNSNTLWPINQMVTVTQLYVRDSVIHYIEAQSGVISPEIEGRLVFQDAPDLSGSSKTVMDASGNDVAEAGEILTYTITVSNAGSLGAAFSLTDTLPTGTTYVTGSLTYSGMPTGTVVTITNGMLMAETAGFPAPPDGGSLLINAPGVIEFAVQVSDPVPDGDAIVNQIELRDQNMTYEIAPASISLRMSTIYLPLVIRMSTQ